MIIFSILVILVVLRFWNHLRKKKAKPKVVVGFFHPYCNDGGGGEAVLWKTIKSIHESDINNKVRIVVYSGDINVKPQDILNKAKDCFGVELTKNVDFVFLKTRFLVEAKMWPRFTMFGQSLGSVVLGFEALIKECPHILLDTMGYAFTFPIFRLLGGCKVGAYVHYPTISNDMVQNVIGQVSSTNNNADVSKSHLKTSIKLWYYKVFAFLYWFVGQFCSVVMVNSSWTKNHIAQRWRPPLVHLIYPAVDCSGFTQIPSDFSGRSREPMIVSIGQFRQEKNHLLQVRAFHKFITTTKINNKVKFVMIGSVRSHQKEDLERVEAVKKLANELGIADRLTVAQGIPKSELKNYLGKAVIGLHTMTDEHFGIGVVEFMAAGVIPIAHNSAGPKEDIVVPFNGGQTGFLATTADEYAQKIEYILSHPQEAAEMQSNARKSVGRFSDEMFQKKILEVLSLFPELSFLRVKKLTRRN